MKRLFLKSVMAFFMLTFISGHVFAETSFGRIVYVDRNLGFVIFNLGAEDGISEDCLFEVYRRDTEIAEIKTVKVRKRFSGADIECIYKNKAIKVGDTVKVSTRSIKVIERQKREILHEKIEGLLIQAQGYIQNYEYEEAEEKVCEVLNLDPENKKALKMLTEVGWGLRSKFIMFRPEPIILDIDASKSTILSSSLDVFRENNCIVKSSDSLRYSLQAFKNVELSFARAIATDWGPFTRNKIYYTAEITATPKTNRLTIYLRGTYDKEGKVYDYEITKDSESYKEAYEMALMIKDLAEEM